MQWREVSRKRSGITTSTSPLILVGMPRCGSTIFTQILNQSRDLLIINDFYYLQFADEINAINCNDSVTQQKLVDYINYWLIRRIKRSNDEGIGGGLVISPEEEVKIKSYISNFNFSESKNWASILQEIMEYVVATTGKTTWGYNTPQDYLNLELLKKAYPDSKIVFVIRDCRSMLSSYKHIIKEYDYNNDKNRYHPVLQTIAWRTAVRTFLSYRQHHPDNILLVRYEDLVHSTQSTIYGVEEYLATKFPHIELSDFGNNSSFRNKKRKSISNTEVWLCEKLAAKELELLGYEVSGKKPRLQDTLDLLLTTTRAGWFYLHKVATSGNIRKRIFKLAKKIFS